MAFDDIFSPEQGQAVNSVAHSAFLSLLASPGDAPFAAMPRILEGVRANEKLGMTRGARKALLVQAGYPEAQAEQFSADDTTTKLALQQKDNDGLSKLAAGYFGGGAAPAAPASNLGMGPPRLSPAAPGGPAAGATLNGGSAEQSFLSTLVGKESGGNPNAKNPSSTATGLTQFTSGTWGDMMRRHPDLGLTPDGRTDPDQAKKAALAYARDNGQLIAEDGHEVTPGNLYLGHFLGGPGATRFLNGLRSNPNATAASYAEPAAVDANRSVFFNRDGSPKSAQAFYNERTSKFGGAAPTQVADASGAVPTADLPVTDAQEAGFEIPPGQGAQAPGPRTAQALAARQTASSAADADKVKRGLAVIAQSGRYGERAKPMVEAIKLQLQPLLKNMEETEAQKLVKAAGLPEDQARSVLAGAIAGNASTSLQKEYNTYRQQEQAAGRTPLSQFDYDVALSRAKAASTKVEIGGEKSYDSDQGKAYSDVMKEAQTAGRRAPSVIATLNQAEQLMSTPGFKSGLGSTFALPAKQVLAALGGDPKAPASMEAFRSLSNKAVTDALGGSLGAGVSNSDVSFLQKQVASLDNSVEGNRAIISSARRVAEHQQKVADFTSDYADRNGGRLDRNYDRELRAWAKQNPIFTPEERGEKPAADAKPAAPMNTTDRAVSIRNAKAFIAANPGKRDAVIERLKAAGINTENF